MARVLAISSHVARGHVGLSAIVPALQALGHDVVAMPTIVLSNHPGHQAVASTPMATDVLTKMRGALEQNGWLSDIDAVLSGYLPTPDHAVFVAETVGKVRDASAKASPPRRSIYCCDPVLGDTPKGLYVKPEVAVAIRDMLVPIADLTTPNVFELGWLTDTTLPTADAATRAARGLNRADCYVTSVNGASATQIANLFVARRPSGPAQAEPSAHIVQAPLYANVPNGTGDLFAALVIGARLVGLSDAVALKRVTEALSVIAKASIGHAELDLVSHLPELARLIRNPTTP